VNISDALIEGKLKKALARARELRSTENSEAMLRQFPTALPG
jgi:hypothetical protein